MGTRRAVTRPQRKQLEDNVLSFLEIMAYEPLRLDRLENDFMNINSAFYTRSDFREALSALQEQGKVDITERNLVTLRS